MRLSRGPFLRYGIRGTIAASLLGAALSRIPDSTQLTAQSSDAVSADPIPPWQLETRIYRALRADELLGRLRIGVSVRDRNVELWGSVPDADSETRAVSIVTGMAGVGEVVSRLRRVAPEDPLLAEVANELKRRSDGIAFAGGGPTPALPTQRPDRERDSIALALPPVIPGRNASTQPIRPREAVTLKPERPEPVGDVGLLAAIEAVRDGEASGKYLDLKLSVRDRFVYVSGRVDKKSHAIEFAGLLADVPGVKRVVVQKVEFR